MITQMRNYARSWLIKILLGIIVITFVVSFGVGTFSDPKSVLVRLDSEEILYPEFNRRYQEELDALRRRFPENADVLAQQIKLREQVLTRMINRHLMLRAAREKGLMVTDREVEYAVKSQDIFRLDGKFHFETYRTILVQNRMTPEAYESRLREDLLLQKYQRNLLAGIVLSNGEIDQRYRLEHEKVTVDYIEASADPFMQTVRIAPEAVEKYYEAHNKDFTQAKQFRVEYFVLDTAYYEPKVTVRDRAIEHYYERNPQEFTQPKRVRASHILKSVGAEAPPEKVAEIRAGMEQILAEARRGVDFAALARRHSDDFSKDKGGDLGFFTREQMVSEFADAAFALAPGEISDIVRSQFGFHIIKVTGEEPEVRRSFDEVRPEIVKHLREQQAERKLRLEADRLPQKLEAEGLAQVAKALEVSVQTSDWFDGTGVLPKLGSSAPLYARLRTAKEGTIGVWRRNPVQGHVFYRVAEVKEPYIKPLKEVREEVTALVRRQQAGERALALAKETLKSFKGPQDFQAFARKHGYQVKTASFTATQSSIPELGSNREFQQAAFRLTPEQPFGLGIQGKHGFLLHLKKRALPPEEEAARLKAEVRAEIEQEMGQYLLAKEIERLKTVIEVEIVSPEFVAVL